MAHDLALATIPNNIDSAGVLRQFVVNLFYGWGYSAYRQEDKDRADDLLVRQQVGHWLGQARAEVARQESVFRREHLPAPTRENPYLDKTAVVSVQAYQRLQQSIEALGVAVHTAAVPEDDRTWRRHRSEGETLKRLLDSDLAIAEAAIQILREVSVDNLDPDRRFASFDLLKGALEQRTVILSVLR